jgi:hypothetical protein
MARLEVKNLKQPDEKRPFVDKGMAEIFNFGEGAIGRAVFEPGWKWSQHVGPISPGCSL